MMLCVLLIALSLLVNAAPSPSLSNRCLWMSEVNSILNHEYEALKNTAAGTCILREGRSELMREFECEKIEDDDNGVGSYIRSVECKKCLRLNYLWEMVRECVVSRSD